MKFGLCGNKDLAASAVSAGYEFIEGNAGNLLKGTEPEDAFLAELEEVRSMDLPCPVVNCFVPGKLKITGPDADMDKLTEFVTTTMQRAQVAGIDTVVFGSGAAREVPEGFDRSTAYEQIKSFCLMTGPIAQDNGVIVVVEPLAAADCNILTHVAECASLVKDVDHPAIRLLVDAYHHMRNDDSYEDIAANGHLLAHTHIATVPDRRTPGAEPCDLKPFFDALKSGGYNGRVSIEGKIASEELPAALELMLRLAG